MNHKFSSDSAEQSRNDIATRWVIDADNGLSPAQQDELHEWLVADTRNRQAYQRNLAIWSEFDRIAGLDESMADDIDMDLLKPKPAVFVWKRTRAFYYAGLSMAAMLVIGALVMLSRKPEAVGPVAPILTFPARIEQYALQDGSNAELRRGSELQILYSAHERRVRLLKGEAVFSVAKDPNRPFRVEVGDLELEALGTVFNVKEGPDRIEVLVAEGRVKMTSEADLWGNEEETNAEENGEPTLQIVIETFEQASVSLEASVPKAELIPVDQSVVDRTLLWRPQRLEFSETPLVDIVNEFNRRNELQIRIASRELGELPITSIFWSDDVEAFVRLMEHGFGLKSSWIDEKHILLSRTGR